MKLRDLLEMAKEEPELLDYTMNLSEYMSVPDDDGEGDFTVVTDFPIRAIVSNEEEKELRFVLTKSDFHLIEHSKDRVLEIIQDKKD